MAEPFVTAEAVATDTGVTAETIRAWARAGVIPGYRPGGREWLFLWSEVAEAIRATRHQPIQAEAKPRRERRLRSVPVTTTGTSSPTIDERFRALQRARR
jgi:excisionase family DNA binding protein